jgi:hypothetical protein
MGTILEEEFADLVNDERFDVGLPTLSKSSQVIGKDTLLRLM